MEFDELETIAAARYAEYLAALESGESLEFSEWLERSPEPLRPHLVRLEAARRDIDSVLDRTAHGRQLHGDSNRHAPDPSRPLAEDPLVGALPDVGTEGKRLGKCILRTFLGKGAYGRVYLARHVEFECDVAVKCLERRLLESGSFQIERFKNEARTAVRVTHQNLIRIHDLGEEHGLHFIVMEFVPGENLADRLRSLPDGRFSDDEVWKIARDVASALAALHRRGIVHRDIKPSNILMTKDGEVKLADLGLAKGPESPDVSLSTQPLGTYPYMSPEVFRGAKNAREASDVWSLGATLAHLRAGRPCIARGEVDFGKIAAALTGAGHPSIREFVPDCDPRLASLIDRCVSFEARRRFRDASELLDEIDRLHSSPRGVHTPRSTRLRTISAYLALVVILAASRHFWSDGSEPEKNVADPPPAARDTTVEMDSVAIHLAKAQESRHQTRYAEAVGILESLDSDQDVVRSCLADTYFDWGREAEDARQYEIAVARYERSHAFGHYAAEARRVHCASMRLNELEDLGRLVDALRFARSVEREGQSTEVSSRMTRLANAIAARIESGLRIDPPPGTLWSTTNLEITIAIDGDLESTIVLDGIALERDQSGVARGRIVADDEGTVARTLTVVGPAEVRVERTIEYRFDLRAPTIEVGFADIGEDQVAIAVLDEDSTTSGRLWIAGASIAEISRCEDLVWNEHIELIGKVGERSARVTVDGVEVPLGDDGSFRHLLEITSDRTFEVAASDGAHVTIEKVSTPVLPLLRGVVAKRDAGVIRYFAELAPDIEMMLIPAHHDLEGRQHSPFFIGRLEISNRLYGRSGSTIPERVEGRHVPSLFEYRTREQPIRACENLDEYLDRYGDYPVIGLTFADCRAFAKGLGGDLPTRDQYRFAAEGPDRWTFAFQSGSPSRSHGLANWSGYVASEGDFDSAPEDHWQEIGTSREVDARYRKDGYLYTAPCDHSEYPEGPFGTMQQSGNVEEWLVDEPKDQPDLRWAAGGSYRSRYARIAADAVALRRCNEGSLDRGFRIVIPFATQ